MCAGWRRFLQWTLKNRVVITVFSEALAAVGIVAAGASFTYDSWKGREVSLEGAVISSTPSHISLLITNSGGVDAAIRKVSLVSDLDIKNQVRIKGDGLLVEKGKSQILSSEPSRLNTTVQFEDQAAENNWVSRAASTPCQAVIEFVIAGEGSKTATVDFVCYAATIISDESLERLQQIITP